MKIIRTRLLWREVLVVRSGLEQALLAWKLGFWFFEGAGVGARGFVRGILSGTSFVGNHLPTFRLEHELR